MLNIRILNKALSLLALFCFSSLLLSNCSTPKTADLQDLVRYYRGKYPDDASNKKEKGRSLKVDKMPLAGEIGEIKRIENRVSIKRNEKTVFMQESETKLFREDQLFTTSHGKAHIVLIEGGEVFMAPTSSLYFNTQIIDKSNHEHELNLKGKVRAKVKLVRGRKFIVKTAQANIIIKGTDFVVDASGGSTKVAALEGAVEVIASKTNQRIEITGNKSVSVSTAGQVSKPKEIDPEIINDLEYSGETGIEKLDKVIEKKYPIRKEQKRLKTTPQDKDCCIKNADFNQGLRFGLGANLQTLTGKKAGDLGDKAVGSELWLRYFPENSNVGFGINLSTARYNLESSYKDKRYLKSSSIVSALTMSLDGMCVFRKRSDWLRYFVYGFGNSIVDAILKYKDGSASEQETYGYVTHSFGIGEVYYLSPIENMFLIELRYYTASENVVSDGILKLSFGITI